MKILIALCGAATLLYGADISGKWTGTSELVDRDGQVIMGAVLMTLHQRGEDVTGTAGPSEERQAVIQNGKLRGDKLTFVASEGDQRGELELRLIDGELRGQATFQRESGAMIFKLVLKRE